MRCLTFPTGPIFGADGKIVPGGILVGYEPSTDNLKPWFLDEALTTNAPNPLQAGSDGRVAQVYLDYGKYEVREFRPTSPLSVIPDDMTDFPQNDEWELVTSWIVDGGFAAIDQRIEKVDFVADLYQMGRADADWVLVMNYDTYGDCFPRYFYHAMGIPPSSDNGSTLVSANDGGMWVLQKGYEPLDCRVFGVKSDGTDMFARLVAACNWCNSFGQTLFVPRGTYTLGTSGTINAFCDVVFGGTVGFSPKDGANVTLALHGSYRAEQTSAFKVGNDGDFILDLTNAIGGTDGDSRWWGNCQYAMQYCCGNVPLHVEGDDGSVAAPLQAHYAAVDVTDGVLALTGTGTIDKLTSSGGSVKTTYPLSLTLGEAWTSAFGGRIDLPWLISPINLYVDADVELGSAGALPVYWTDVTLHPRGGLLNLETAGQNLSLDIGRISCEAPVFGSRPDSGHTYAYAVTAETGALKACHFDRRDGVAMLNLADNNYFVADLGGLDFNVAYSGIAGAGIKTARNGSITNAQFTRAFDIAFENVSISGQYIWMSDGTLSADTCSISLSNASNGISLAVGANLVLRDCTVNAVVNTDLGDTSTPTTNHAVSASGCHFKKACTFRQCALSLLHDVFDVRFLLDYPQKTVIKGCEYTGTALAFWVDHANSVYGYDPDVTNNTPAPASADLNANTARWPQTEGHIIHTVTADDLLAATTTWDTRWGTAQDDGGVNASHCTPYVISCMRTVGVPIMIPWSIGANGELKIETGACSSNHSVTGATLSPSLYYSEVSPIYPDSEQQLVIGDTICIQFIRRN